MLLLRLRHDSFDSSHTDAVVQVTDAPILGRLPIDPELAHLADIGEIERYEHAAYTELAAAFVEAVPAVEPMPAAPWMT
jgi:hypothetical protein